MYNKPLCETLEFKEAIPPGNKTATITGEEVDVSNALRFVTFAIHTGTVNDLDGTKYFTFKVQQATASGGSFSDMGSEQYVNVANSWDKILDASGDANTVRRMTVELAAGYDFLKLIGTITGAGDADIEAMAVFAPKRTPTT